MYALLLEEERTLITGDAANQLTFQFIPGSSTISEYRETLRAVDAETARRYYWIYISHGTGNVPISLFADLDALCEQIQDRTDDAIPFEFMGAKGLVARRPLEGIEDPGANIVYLADRI